MYANCPEARTKHCGEIEWKKIWPNFLRQKMWNMLKWGSGKQLALVNTDTSH